MPTYSPELNSLAVETDVGLECWGRASLKGRAVVKKLCVAGGSIAGSCYYLYLHALFRARHFWNLRSGFQDRPVTQSDGKG